MKSPIANRAVAALMVGALLAGCAQMQSEESSVENNPKAVLGALGGAAAAGILAAALGGKAPVVIASALAGGLLGGYIGHKLDARDKQMAAEAATRAFEQNASGQPSVWNNPDSGNHGQVVPTHTYQLATGQYCREYTQTIWIGNDPQKTSGTACRQPDGSWQVQNT